MSLSLAENLRITHNINTQNIKYSKFKIINTDDNIAHKNVIISISNSDQFDFKITQSETLISEELWSNDSISNQVTVAEINPKQTIDFVLRTQVNGNTQPNIYDCEFNVTSLEVIYS